MKNTLMLMAAVFLLVAGCKSELAPAVNQTPVAPKVNDSPNEVPEVNQTPVNNTPAVEVPVTNITPETNKNKVFGTIRLQTCYHQPVYVCRMENFTTRVALSTLQQNITSGGPTYSVEEYQIAASAQSAGGMYSIYAPDGKYSVLAQLNSSWFCRTKVNQTLCAIELDGTDVQFDIMATRQVY